MASALAAGDAVVMSTDNDSGVAEFKEADGEGAVADVAAVDVATDAVVDGTAVAVKGEKNEKEVLSDIMTNQGDTTKGGMTLPSEEGEEKEDRKRVINDEEIPVVEEEEIGEFVETLYEPLQSPWYLVIKANNMGNEALAQVEIKSFETPLRYLPPSILLAIDV